MTQQSASNAEQLSDTSLGDSAPPALPVQQQEVDSSKADEMQVDQDEKDRVKSEDRRQVGQSLSLLLLYLP